MKELKRIFWLWGDSRGEKREEHAHETKYRETKKVAGGSKGLGGTEECSVTNKVSAFRKEKKISRTWNEAENPVWTCYAACVWGRQPRRVSSFPARKGAVGFPFTVGMGLKRRKGVFA